MIMINNYNAPIINNYFNAPVMIRIHYFSYPYHIGPVIIMMVIHIFVV